MTEGLRERKRRETHESLQRAALELVLERGSLSVTVDEIAARADVSPRTFFNYFQAREDAIVGDEALIPAEITDGIDPSLRIFDALEALAVAFAESMLVDRDLVRLRAQVLRAHPELIAVRIARSKGFEQRFVDFAIERCAADGDDDDVAQRHGRLLGLTATAAVRTGWYSWTAKPGAPSALVAEVEAAFADLHAIARRQLV